MKLKSLIAMLLIGTPLLAQDAPRRNALKTTFLSWATGSVKVYYERALAHHQSIEAAVGAIGVAYDGKDNNPRGWLVRYGHKFNVALTRDDAPLQGLYLKPELALSDFTYDGRATARQRSTMCAYMGVIGYQWAKRKLCVDAYWGIGGAVGTECPTYYEHGYILWDFFGVKNRDISLTSGIKIGYCF